jgi:hypothetical protein
MAGMSAGGGQAAQAPRAVEDLLYDYLSREVPDASEGEWRAAARLLNERGHRSLGLEPASALREAQETAGELRKILVRRQRDR